MNLVVYPPDLIVTCSTMALCDVDDKLLQYAFNAEDGAYFNLTIYAWVVNGDWFYL